MHRNVPRFAVVVAIVLAALATGIGLGFGLYYFFRHTLWAAQPMVSESTSTIRRALD